MTDSEINIAIARACGWKDRPDPFYTDKLAWTHDEGATWVSTCDLPDYCHDLNAMHEAENSVEFPEGFSLRLTAIALRDRKERGDKIWLFSSSMVAWHTAHATARQRAEAFIRVKGLWKEEA